MLIVTTVYYADLQPQRDTVTGKFIETKPSDLKVANRKVVTVYQGTNRVTSGRSR